MAILWQKNIQGRDYQVRSAGNSLRLYTDKVFHTQYNPKQILSGGVWDLLSLPALLHPESSIKRVLVLGVGGGAVIHLLDALIQPQKMVGVELNPVHVQLMKRFFGLKKILKSGRLDLQVNDAIEFVRGYKGAKFDLIIDDLFYEQNGEPHRAIEMDAKWMKALRKCLKRDGLLVCNFVDRKQFKKAACQPVEWQHVFTLTLPNYENCVGVFSRHDYLMTDIKAILKKRAAMDRRISLRQVRFRLNSVPSL